MTTRETGWCRRIREETSSVGRVKPRRGNKPKEGTGGPSVARPADRPGLVGGARPWSRPADTPECVSTDGEGTTESPGIPRISSGPESHRANESSVVHREPETGSGSERRSSRTFPRKRGDSCGVSASPKGRVWRAPRKRPREGNRTWGSGTGGRAARLETGSEPMPGLRHPPEVAGNGTNAATDNLGGGHAAHPECIRASRVGTKLPRATDESSRRERR